MAPIYERDVPNPLSETSEFRIVADIQDGQAVVKVWGEFDVNCETHFTTSLDALMEHEKEFDTFQIDLEEVSFLDLTALGAILEARLDLRNLDKELVILKPSGTVRRLLEIMRVIEIIPIIDS